jgi:hypothetical protein
MLARAFAKRGTMMRLMLAFLVLLGLPAFAATPAAVTSDPPPDKAHPAAMAYVRIPSGGALLNGVLYTASGPGRTPRCCSCMAFPAMSRIWTWPRRSAAPASTC